LASYRKRIRTEKRENIINVSANFSAMKNELIFCQTPQLECRTNQKKPNFLVLPGYFPVAYQPAPYFIKSQRMPKGTYSKLGSTNRITDKATIAKIRKLTHHESFKTKSQVRPESLLNC